MPIIKISLAAARVNAGMTQAEVAKALNVGKNTIVSWEKGNSEPKITQMDKLVELYKIPRDYIFLPIKSIKNGLQSGSTGEWKYMDFFIRLLSFAIGTIIGRVIVDIYHTHKEHKRDEKWEVHKYAFGNVYECYRGIR